MKKYGKFAALIAVVVGTLVWLAFTGGKASARPTTRPSPNWARWATRPTGNACASAGDVESGSIQRVGNQTQFVLVIRTSQY